MTEDEARMTFTEHLGELRDRLIRSMIALVVGVVICFAASGPIQDVLSKPLRALPLKDTPALATGTATTGTPPSNVAAPVAPATNTPTAAVKPPRDFKWTVLNPFESIKVKLKIATYGGLLLAFPFILWQLCAFVFPGLKPSERKLVKILLMGCGTLGILGVAVAYLGVFPLILPYLLEYTPEWVSVQLRLDETLALIVKGLAGFAVAFQFPMVVLTLVYMDLLNPKTLREHRRVVIVGLAVAAAFLTPPDPLSMMIMLVPLLLLYEASIWASYILIRRKNRPSGSTELQP